MKCDWCGDEMSSRFSNEFGNFCNPYHAGLYREHLARAISWREFVYLLLTVGTLFIIGVFVATAAWGSDPHHLWDDSPYKQQIENAQNQRGLVCCDGTDSVQVAEPDIEHGHYTFLYQNKKWQVDDWQMVKQANPLGHALAWFYAGNLRCFWPPSES